MSRRPQPDKPPYSVPLMAEINAMEPCGLKVASTFAGCGGSSLGYRMAGFQVLYANEFVEAARDTYNANRRDWTQVDDRDIRTVTPEDLLERIGMERGELDVLDGSPPCSSFSTAGKRSKKWGQTSSYSDTKQRTDDLFYEYARLVEGVQPKVFVAENVSGLVKGVAKGYFMAIMKRLGECGYRVECRLLDAQWLGVPQSRQRVIFMGVRNDLAASPAYPDPMAYRYSLREALGWTDQVIIAGNPEESTFNGAKPHEVDPDEPGPTVSAAGVHGLGNTQLAVIHDTSGTFSQGDVTDRPCPAILVGPNAMNSRHYKVISYERPDGPARDRGLVDVDVDVDVDVPGPTVMAHGIAGSSPTQMALVAPILGGEGHIIDPETGERIDLTGTAIGREWHRMVQGQISDRYLSLIKAREDAPSFTATAARGGRGTAGIVHPTVARKFTLGELRRLCSFPDDFVLTGSYAQRWERLGRAVPPLMKAVAEAVRDRVLG